MKQISILELGTTVYFLRGSFIDKGTVDECEVLYRKGMEQPSITYRVTCTGAHYDRRHSSEVFTSAKDLLAHLGEPFAVKVDDIVVSSTSKSNAKKTS